MPKERVELSRGCPRGILSPLRLPFRHSGLFASQELNHSSSRTSCLEGTPGACVSYTRYMPSSGPNPIIVFDDSLRIVHANQAVTRLLGTPIEKLRGMHSWDTYHPDEMPGAAERMRRLLPGEEVRFERWMRCSNGRYVRVRALVKRRTIGGYRAEYVPLSTDRVELPAKLAS